MKRNLTLLLIIWYIVSVKGQVVIVPMPHQDGYFTLDNIWSVNLISSQPQTIVTQMEVTVEDAQHQLILSATSPIFNLTQGTNRLAFNPSNAKMQYGTGPNTRALRSTGRFPYGNYIICYNLISINNNALLAEFCQEETIKPFSPPELVNPYNGEEITTTSPLLSWKPPFPPGAIPFEYVLRLVEVKGRQDFTEALEKNAPLLHRRNISGTVLPYPGDAPKLEVGKIYAWQVSAKAGDYDLGVTEIWKFKVARNQMELMSTAAVDYRMLKLSPDGNYNPIEQKLRFMYDNRWGAPKLEYKSTASSISLNYVYYNIYPAGQQASPVGLTALNDLVTGVNKFAIDLQSISGITDGEDYILVLREPTGQLYYLEFTYHD